jgi:hypothetical protein
MVQLSFDRRRFLVGGAVSGTAGMAAADGQFPRSWVIR